MIRIDDRDDDNKDNRTSSVDACISANTDRYLNIVLREDLGDGEYLDRPRHKPGVIGWITGRSGQRLYHPSGGDAEGEAAPVSLETLKEIVKIMEMPAKDLILRIMLDTEYL